MSRAATRVGARQPVPGDARFIAEIERSCFPDPWPVHLFASEVVASGRFHRVFVAADGGLVGYLFSAWQYLDLHVLKIAVLPEHRRQGLAQRLMEMAENHAAEMGGESLTLEVRSGNTAAIALYESMEYDNAGKRRGYYMDGEDAVVMTKKVDW